MIRDRTCQCAAVRDRRFMSSSPTERRTVVASACPRTSRSRPRGKDSAKFAIHNGPDIRSVNSEGADRTGPAADHRPSIAASPRPATSSNAASMGSGQRPRGCLDNLATRHRPDSTSQLASSDSADPCRHDPQRVAQPLPPRPPGRHRYPRWLPTADRAALRGIVYVLCNSVVPHAAAASSSLSDHLVAVRFPGLLSPMELLPATMRW